MDHFKFQATILLMLIAILLILGVILENIETLTFITSKLIEAHTPLPK